MSHGLERHWTIDPDVTFLNHGSFGATPRRVLEHQSALRDQMERQPVKFFLRELPEMMGDARARAAHFVGASPENFAFVDNATSGVNAVLRSLEFEAGDELLVTDHEYNACRNVLDFVAERSGAAVKVVELPWPVTSPDEVVAAIADAVTPATRLFLVDHVTSQSGMVLPLPDIVDACREQGDFEILVDGAHAAGMIDLAVEALEVDYYTGNFHKWVCTPKGAAFLWVASEHMSKIRPTVVSHGANMPAETTAERFRAEFDWTGTKDPTPLLCVPTAIDTMAAMIDGGWPAVREHNRSLALRGRDILNEALGGEPLCPDSMLGSLAAVRLPDGERLVDPSPLFVDPKQDELLFEHGIEVPIFPFPAPPKRVLRISAQLYNDVADYEELARVMRSHDEMS